jgi:pimeloyl-ACP methyl ester carboxylesterase/DNA-binding CsgD family transcriptional regulator
MRRRAMGTLSRFAGKFPARGGKNVPTHLEGIVPTRTRQTIRYLTASDGVRLAWADAGVGMPLVKAANWLTHLSYDLDSPVWRHWISLLASHFRFIRYDERGCGMSDWNTNDLSIGRWTADLEEVIGAADPAGPVILLGISQGAAACIGYAVRHPERVARMILYGAYARGIWRRGDVDRDREYRAIVDLSQQWGRDNPAFRQVFTSRFIPGGSDEQLQWFNELCTKTTSPAIAAQLLAARAEMDVTDLLGSVRVPTLVLHGRQDNVVPIEEGRLLAAGIPGAEFVELDSRNHVLLEHEPAWNRFGEAVLEFTGATAAPASRGPFTSLSQREREVLTLLANGMSNASIAEVLGISDKTVRNHLSHVFDKLGVWSRAQAIVFARERGFVTEPRGLEARE